MIRGNHNAPSRGIAVAAMAKPTTKAPNPIDVHVGSRMRMRRMMLFMSQEALARAFGLTFQQVQKYETGMNRMGASRLDHAAHVLGVDIQFFFEGAPRLENTKAPPPSYINEFVTSRDGLRLIRAFAHIDNSTVRRSIVALVEELAGPE
jgi:transcriptional regulator with XRE-family HTH domain